MATKFFAFVLLILADMCFANEGESLRNDNVILSIGEAFEIALPESASIHISRKGIVDVQVLPSKLRLVGVKNGLVVLTLTQAQNSEEDLKYFITVQTKEDNVPKSIEDLKNLCEGAGLFFQDKTQEIRGSTSAVFLFYRIKQLCESKKPCTFNAFLSEDAVKKVQTDLSESYGPTYEVSVKANGAIAVLVPCNEKISEKEQGKVLQHLSGSELLQKNILIACKKDWYSGYYTLYAKMIVMENGTAKDIGLQSKLELKGALLNPVSQSKLELGLHNALKNKKAKLIGEPVIWLLSGVDARAESGSEILVLRSGSASSKHAKYVWKQIGLDLKVKVFPLDATKVRLQYSFLISSASNDGGQIQRNKLESEVELSLEKSAIVGGIQFKTSGDTKDSLPLIDSIPIFGPLFRRSEENENESNIFLYFYLTNPKSEMSWGPRE